MKKGSIFLVMVLSFVCAGNALALENLKKTVAVFEFQNDLSKWPNVSPRLYSSDI